MAGRGLEAVDRRSPERGALMVGADAQVIVIQTQLIELLKGTDVVDLLSHPVSVGIWYEQAGCT